MLPRGQLGGAQMRRSLEPASGPEVPHRGGVDLAGQEGNEWLSVSRRAAACVELSGGGVESRTVPGRFAGFLLTGAMTGVLLQQGAMTGVLLQQGLEIITEIPTGSLFAASKSDEEWCIVFSMPLTRLESRRPAIEGLVRWVSQREFRT